MEWREIGCLDKPHANEDKICGSKNKDGAQPENDYLLLHHDPQQLSLQVNQRSDHHEGVYKNLSMNRANNRGLGNHHYA